MRAWCMNAPRNATGGVEESCANVNKPSIMDWNIAELIGKNFLFFEAQETGMLPTDHRVEWRGDSYANDQHKGRDLSRGWSDAGGVLLVQFYKTKKIVIR
jgi:endoglucanase